MSTITTNISIAIDTLQQGELVAIPTETVYGLAADATNQDAVQKVYAFKHRPFHHPLIVHIHQKTDITTLAKNIPDYAYALMEQYWPGPLTLVLQAKEKALPSLVTAGHSTIALRCPAHPVAQALLHALPFPLVAPSANPFGKLSPTTAEHVKIAFSNAPLLILDGGRCSVGIESTIIAATDPKGYSILRPGIIHPQELPLPEKKEVGISTIPVSGNLLHHYQPQKPLYGFSHRSALLQFLQTCREEVYSLAFCNLETIKGYAFPSSPEKAAFELYYQLLQADLSSAKILAVELPPDMPSWQPIRERLLKACSN